MQYDYYACQQECLSEDDCLPTLEEAVVELERAKSRRDRDARQEAEPKVESSAKKAVEIEPHLSYLWYESQSNNCKNNIRDVWQKNLTTQQIPEFFQFTPNPKDLEQLPQLSFILKVPFVLKKPYLSKDDRAFHILDNPVHKDKVFQTPMVAPSSWKGALQSAMIQQFVEWSCSLDERDSRIYLKQFVATRISLARIFGTEKNVQTKDENFQSYLDHLGNDHLSRWYRRYIQRKISSTGFFSGRLYFYPTFFDRISLEVINPHDRKKGTGKNPILIESVPIGATGEFVILYVPFGKVDEIQVAQDLELVAKGVEAMLRVYGFGAKTSSGFGVVDIKEKIGFAIRADWPELKKIQISSEQAEFLNSDGSLKQDFLNDDGTLKSESQYKKFLQRQNQPHNPTLYKKVKKWYKENQERFESSSDLITSQTFNNLSQLSDRANQIIQNLGKSQ